MEILTISVLTFLASILGTISGFGISTIMVPIVLLFLPFGETLLFVGVVHWFGDIWKMVLFRKGFSWKIILFFGIPGIITSFLGAYLTFSIPEAFLTRAVGILIVSYVLFIFIKPSFKIKPNPSAALTGGALSGFLGGLTGVGGGAIRSVFLTAFNLEKEVYIFTSGAIGLAIDASRILTYFGGGTRINSNLTFGLLFFIPASFLGAKIAKVIVDKIPKDKFRMVIALFLLALGVKFAIWP